MGLLFVLILIPVIEIALYIEIGGEIGVWPTIGMTFLTAMIGVAIARAQGLLTLGELQTRLDAGADPREPMVHGAMLLVAGVMLLIPGFMTDTIGFALLIPPVRAFVIRRVAANMTVHAARDHGPGHGRSGPTVVDGDYEVVDENEPTKPGDSGWTKGPDQIGPR